MNVPPIIPTVSGRVPPMPLDCIDDQDGECGPAEYRSVPGGTPTARCDRHFEARMDRYEDSMERYADSDLPPAWFDPSYTGESWDGE